MAEKYSEEFKEQALELARETSVGESSRRLGVSEKAIYTWRQAKRLSECKFRSVSTTCTHF